MGHWLSGRGSSADAAVGPLAWSAAALSRRELTAGVFSAAASFGDGQLWASVGALPPVRVKLFGDGTAEHPDAGLLGGSGFSFTAETCVERTCDGGNAGLLFGNGGNGFNGGDGGRASLLFGDCGAGGADEGAVQAALALARDCYPDEVGQGTTTLGGAARSTIVDLGVQQSVSFVNDAIRKQLADEGILLEDTPQGVRWKRA
jgi:hypothetical protein